MGCDLWKIMVVLGTRPEAIKLAPVIRHLQSRPDHFQPIIVATAQHREMLDQVLRLFDIAPHYDLDLMLPQQSLSDLTARSLSSLGPIMVSEQPDMVLVQGDTTTVLSAALTAYYLKIPLGHVEAGLRTYKKFEPFPEEMNRRVTSVLAELHFAPTAVARDNLLRENIPAEAIHVTGNTVIDALLSVVKQPFASKESPFDVLDSSDAKVILVTAHRRENWGKPLRSICAAVRRLVEQWDIIVVFPVHRNPVVRDVVQAELGGLCRVLLTGPLDYAPFVHLINRSYLILTDSGGVQEEAPSLGKPVLVLREVTERPEGVAAGALRVIGTDADRIVSEASRLLSEETVYNAMSRAGNPYGDGHAAERIVDFISEWFEARHV